MKVNSININNYYTQKNNQKKHNSNSNSNSTFSKNDVIPKKNSSIFALIKQKSLISNKKLDINLVRNIRLKHSDKLYHFIKNSSKLNAYDKGVGLLKIIKDAYKDELCFINAGYSSNYQKNTSTTRIKSTIEKITQILETKNINNKESSFYKNAISFGGRKILTKSQKSDCHAIIHTASLICAGISAAMGELCLTKADLPFIITTEMGMFAGLTNTLNADPTAAMLHASKHMASAGTIGMNILQEIWNIAGAGAHIATSLTTIGLGNIAVSGAIRTGNGLLSATLCESMGWSFVKDYQNGKMNLEDKALELLAYNVFRCISDNLNDVDDFIDLEPSVLNLQETAAKSLGVDIVNNMPKDVGFFIQKSNELLQSNLPKYAAKGFEIVIPKIAQYAIISKGNINYNDIENIIQGALFSIATKEIISKSQTFDSNSINSEVKSIMKILMNDNQICVLITKELIKQGIMQSGKIILNEDTANSLGNIFDNLVPEIIEVYEGIKESENEQKNTEMKNTKPVEYNELDMIGSEQFFGLHLSLQKNIIKRNFLDFIAVEKQGYKVPEGELNGILITGKSKEARDEMVNWIIQESGVYNEKVIFNKNKPLESMRQILEKARHAETVFPTNNIRTIIYVENLDDFLADQSSENLNNISMWNNFAKYTSEEYHTTILFQSDKPEKLEAASVAPHRVGTTVNLDLEYTEADKKEEEK